MQPRAKLECDFYHADKGLQQRRIVIYPRAEWLNTSLSSDGGGLPDLLGDELAQRVRALKPAVGIVFATGQSQVADFKGQARVCFLKKPFQLAQLQEALELIADPTQIT